MVKTTDKPKKTTEKATRTTTRKKAPVEREPPVSTSRKHSESFRTRRKPKTRAAEPAPKPARKPRAGTVVLAPDVLLYFPDADAVNRALRQLIRLIPRRRAAKKSE